MTRVGTKSLTRVGTTSLIRVGTMSLTRVGTMSLTRVGTTSLTRVGTTSTKWDNIIRFIDRRWDNKINKCRDNSTEKNSGQCH